MIRIITGIITGSIISITLSFKFFQLNSLTGLFIATVIGAIVGAIITGGPKQCLEICKDTFEMCKSMIRITLNNELTEIVLEGIEAFLFFILKTIAYLSVPVIVSILYLALHLAFTTHIANIIELSYVLKPIHVITIIIVMTMYFVSIFAPEDVLYKKLFFMIYKKDREKIRKKVKNSSYKTGDKILAEDCKLSGWQQWKCSQLTFLCSFLRIPLLLVMILALGIGIILFTVSIPMWLMYVLGKTHNRNILLTMTSIAIASLTGSLFSNWTEALFYGTVSGLIFALIVLFLQEQQFKFGPNWAINKIMTVYAKI